MLLISEMVVFESHAVAVPAWMALLFGLAWLLVASAAVGLTVWLLMRRRRSEP